MSSDICNEVKRLNKLTGLNWLINAGHPFLLTAYIEWGVKSVLHFTRWIKVDYEETVDKPDIEVLKLVLERIINLPN